MHLTRFFKTFIVLLAMWTAGGCSSAANAPAPGAPIAQATAADIVRAPVDRKIYPGISVAVGNSAGTIAASAYGSADTSRQIALTPATPMRVASVSKSITAAAILLLDQNGTISIDKPVSTYVPQYVYGSQMTVRQLLSNTSGIQGRNHGDPIIHGDGPMPLDLFFSRLNATPLYATSGSMFDYANENFYLAAVVVQNATGLSFADFLRQRIFGPAGMTSTYSDEGRANVGVALGYVHRTTSDPFLQCPAPDWTNALGSGGIISTPSDIVRFDLALTSGKLLDAQHRALMFAPAISTGSGMSYALGWFVYPGNLIQHQGDFATVTAINALFPDGTAVVQIANGADLSPDFDRTYFATQLQNQYGGTPFPLGTPNPPSLLALGPFSTCEQLSALVFGP